MILSFFLSLLLQTHKHKGQWNFVIESPRDYVPHILSDKNTLDQLLAEQSIVNQTTLELTGEQMEILALGLNFVPAFPQKNLEQIHGREIDDWSQKIDTALYFAHHVNSNAKPSKGWLQKDLDSDWIPPTGSWRDDPCIADLRKNHLFVENEQDNYLTPAPIKEAIKSLKENQQIHIMKADKGRNAVIWLTEDYDKEALRQLGNTSNYKELTRENFEHELNSLANKVDQQAVRLFDANFLSYKEKEAIVKAPPKGSYAYFLAKTHKGPEPTNNTFHGRPIVATHSAKIHLLDKYLTRVTSPLLTKIPGSLQDTFDLLNRLPKETPFEKTAIITADVNSLYPCIPWKEGLESSKLFYQQNLTWLRNYANANGLLQPPDLASFAYAIDLVLTNSYITFKNKKWFRQLCGTAMGMCVSVYFANAYMYQVTKMYADNLPSRIHTFLRYIDDVIIIFDNSPSTVENPNIFDSQTGHLKDCPFFVNISNEFISYTIEGPSDSQSFLDIYVSIDHVNNSISTSPYKKPTSSSTFLHARSNHPMHTFRAIPIAQFQRLRRISSTLEIFKTAAESLMSDLIKCGYNRKDIWAGYNKALNTSRHALSKNPRNLPKRQQTEKSFKFITRHNTASTSKINHKILSQIHETARMHYVRMGDKSKNDVVIQRAHCLGRNCTKIVTTVGQNVGSYFTKSIKNPDV